MNAIAENLDSFVNPDSLMDVTRLRGIAELAETRGDVQFTLGGGVLFDTPMTKAERLALPPASSVAPRFVDLPMDRFLKYQELDADFAAFVERYTVAHADQSYRLVVVPITGRLSARQLHVLSDAAEAFGHGSLRLTPDVSIRLPNIPVALLRPLYRALQKAGLINAKKIRAVA
jgi:hypothetical protein